MVFYIQHHVSNEAETELDYMKRVVKLIPILICLGDITIAWEITLLISIQVDSSCKFLKYLNSLFLDAWWYNTN